MDILRINLRELMVFILIFFRIAGVFVSAPVLSSQSIPRQLKIIFVFMCALLLYPLFVQSLAAVPADVFQLGILVCKETTLGLLIGFVANFVFWGIQAAGEIVAREMGLSMAEMFDPVLDMQTSLVGQFNLFVAMLMFLILNGHHWVLNAAISSFREVPLGTFSLSAPSITALVQMSCRIFVLAVKLSAPVFVALFLITAVLGIMERMVPQMHMFAVGFPLKIGVGFLMLLVSLEFSAYMFNKFFLIMNDDLDLILASMKGGG